MEKKADSARVVRSVTAMMPASVFSAGMTAFAMLMVMMMCMFSHYLLRNLVYKGYLKKSLLEQTIPFSIIKDTNEVHVVHGMRR